MTVCSPLTVAGAAADWAEALLRSLLPPRGAPEMLNSGSRALLWCQAAASATVLRRNK